MKYEYHPGEDVEIIVGDEKQDKFFPRMKIKRWDNEVNFSVGIITDEKGSNGMVGDKVEWDDGHGTKARFYEKKPYQPPTAVPSNFRHIDLGEINPDRMAALHELPVGDPTIITYVPDRDVFMMFGYTPLADNVVDISAIPAMRYRGYGQEAAVMFGDPNTFIIDIQFDDTVYSADAIYAALSDAYCKVFDLTGRRKYYNAAGEKVVSFAITKDHVIGYLRLQKIDREKFLLYCTDIIKNDAACYKVGGLGIGYDDVCAMVSDTFTMVVGLLTDKEKTHVIDIEKIVGGDGWINDAIRTDTDYNTERNVMEVRSQTLRDRFEFEIEIAEKPVSGEVLLSIETKGLDFFYQPHDVPEGCWRPDNVKGSYAVYHKDMQGGKYRAGKAFHIYRPFVTDANGKQAWCDMKITGVVMHISIPGGLVYPIVIDPTFGCAPDDPGSSWQSTGGVPIFDMFGSLFISPADIATAQSVTAYCVDSDLSGSFSIKGIAVLHSNLNIITDGVGSPAGVTSSAAWSTSDFASDPDIDASTEHVLFIIPSSTGSNNKLAYDVGDTDQGHKCDNDYTTPTNPTDAVHNNNLYSIYCTYIEEGNFKTENCFNAANSGYISVAKLDETHFVAAYKDTGDAGYGCARVGSIANGIITYGAENVFYSGETADIFVCRLDDTHFAIVYNKVDANRRGEAVVGSVSGVTITYGSPVSVASNYTKPRGIAALDSTHFVVVYVPASVGSAVVGTVSGLSISFGSSATFASDADWLDDNMSVAALDSTHFVVIYSDNTNSDYGTAKIGVTSGNTIQSFGTANVFNSAATSGMSVATLDSTHFVVEYSDTGDAGYGCARVGLVSGTTISSYGTENCFNSISTYYSNVAAIDSTHFVVVYRDHGGDTYGYSRVGLVSGTTISSYGTDYCFNSVSTFWVSVAALNSSNFVVAYNDDGGADYGCARVWYEPPSGNPFWYFNMLKRRNS